MTNKSRTIGNTATIYFGEFNKRVEGKVDTGATTSSLHATDISVNGGTVTFVCPMLSDHVCKLPVTDTQHVQSADGGTTARPVVTLDVVVEGQQLGPQEFNLNDRSNMEAGLLIGQNILQAGDFLIDVNTESDKVDDPNGAHKNAVSESKETPKLDRYVSAGTDCLVTLQMIGDKADAITMPLPDLIKALKNEGGSAK